MIQRKPLEGGELKSPQSDKTPPSTNKPRPE